MTRLQLAASRVVSFFDFFEAEAELIDEPMEDDEVFMSFMGSGASDILTVGDMRELANALKEEVKDAH